SQDEKTQTIERQKQTITSMETVIQKLNETIPVQNQLISQQQISLTHNVKQIKQKFDPNRHNGPRVMTYKVCLKYMENGKGLTRQEIIDLYRKEYRAPDADISRRIYELTTPEYGNLLFIHADDDGRSRFFLTQNPSAEDLAHVGDPFGKKLSPLEGGKPVA
ncbi:MAG: hypothetical protein M1540_01945, partial [Candidatus Bathyarchaeota archaeon]|nr:hypothetical protein [Candidatus Bathyarchaeota archaeon]